VAETALAVALLAAAGLLLRSFVGILGVDPGFEAKGVQTVAVSIPDSRYPSAESRAALTEALVSGLAAQPGVTAAAATMGLPLTNFGYVISISSLDGVKLSSEEGDRLSLQVRVVTPDYFRAVGMRVTRGRGLRAGDRAGAPTVAVLSEKAAALLWPGCDPLGHSVRLGTRLGQEERAGGEVIGIANDVRSDGPIEPARPTIYLAHAQFPVGYLTFVARTDGPPERLIEPSRALLQRLDPELPMFRVRSLRQLADAAVARPRLYLTLVAVFAALALVLAAIGIYGVQSHAVGQRTREIGIRLALGAGRRRVTAQVAGRGALLAAAGAGLGLALALVAQRALAGLLVGVSPTDPATYAAVALGAWLVGLGAAWLPARRAARIDPARALREE
jgi:predicted permease